MPWWSRSRVLVPAVLRWILVLWALWKLLKWSLAAFCGYDKLWLFTNTPYHRFTSMAMLSGTLHLRNALSKVGHDEQVYNGAGYTNWGFGVPALQMPFHAVAARTPILLEGVPSRFFPDRAIFFFYLAAMIPFLWAAFDRLLAMRPGAPGGRLQRHALSWSAVLLALSLALYPLTSCRFFVYEETIAYLVVFELLAIGAYIFALRSWSAPAVVGMAVAAGVGLLVRPTGLVLVGVLAALVVLEGRGKKSVAVFAAALRAISAGLVVRQLVEERLPLLHRPVELVALLRASHADGPLRQHLRGHPAAFQAGGGAPLPFVLHGPSPGRRQSLLLDRGVATSTSKRARRSPSPMRWSRSSGSRCCSVSRVDPAASSGAPRAPAGRVCAPRRAAGPLRRLRVGRRGLRLALHGGLLAAHRAGLRGCRWGPSGGGEPASRRPPGAGLHRHQRRGLPAPIEPAETTVLTLAPEKAAVQWDAFNDSRWAIDAPVPSHIECGDRLVALVNNGLGWSPGCFVNTFTNVYLGVPAKRDDGYIVRFQVEGASDPTLEVYVNGRIYTARAIWQRLRRGRAHPIPRADVAHRGGDHPVDAEPRPPPDQAADPSRSCSGHASRHGDSTGSSRAAFPLVVTACHAAAVPASAASASLAPRALDLSLPGWLPENRARLDALLAARGRSSARYDPARPAGGDPRLGQHHDAQRHRRRRRWRGCSGTTPSSSRPGATGRLTSRALTAAARAVAERRVRTPPASPGSRSRTRRAPAAPTRSTPSTTTARTARRRGRLDPRRHLDHRRKATPGWPSSSPGTRRRR